MSKIKFQLNTVIEEDYDLIAIHSSAEDYHMAYLLNNFIKTQFIRRNEDLAIYQNNQIGEYSIYEHIFNDDFYWHLIQNNCTENIKSSGVFEKNLVKTHLIPEKKKVDYFLKIDGNYYEELVNEISEIPQVIFAYAINPETLKSKDYLIF